MRSNAVRTSAWLSVAALSIALIPAEVARAARGGSDRAPASNSGAADADQDVTNDADTASSPDAPPAPRRRAKNGAAVPQRVDGELPRSFPRPRTPRDDAQRTPVESASVTASLPNAGQSRVDTAPPAHTATRTQVEQLIQRSQGAVDFFELVDDMLDELAHQLAREDPGALSPMAIRLVRLSANLRPEFARTLESRLVARVVNATGIKMTICAECTALHSRVEEGSWVLTLGAVKQDDLRRLGETTGVKTFMDVDFTFSPESNVIWMEAVAFRASDGGVVWTDAYRSDGTMVALLRSGRRIPSRAERAAELEQKIAGRPSYGYAASLGMAQVGYTGPTGNITGAQAALRFHERFGDDQANLFGLSAGIFTTGPPSQNKQPQALNSIMLGAYYSYDLSQPNLNRPELWAYAEGGGIFSGNEGNTFYVEGGGDLHLKWRMSLAGGVMYIFPTKYSGYDMGGVGFRLRIAMNW